MRAEIVTIGTELLLGQIVDTNSAWLAQRLAAAGVNMHYQTKVGDNHARMVEVLRLALSRADAVILTGGLGPTQDDITREAISEVTRRPLARDPEIVRRITELFGSRGREMPESNLRQADVPAGAEWIDFPIGTAPGLIVPAGPDGSQEARTKVVYAVPGVPAEMKEMFERVLLPDLLSRMGETVEIRSRILKCWISESRMAQILAPRVEANEDGPVTVAFLAGEREVRTRLTARAPSDELGAILDAEEAACRRLLGDNVFGVDDDTLASVCLRMLVDQGRTLSAAESLTGGMVGEWLTDVPGASAAFLGSAVSYSAEAKTRLLGVPAELVDEHGPVSDPVARAMAAGARRVFGSDVGIAVTGSAGPLPDAASAVGDVFHAVDLGGGDVTVVRIKYPGDRPRVRTFAAATVLDLLRRRLQGVPV